MCGIVGFAGSRPAAAPLLEGLARLTYRGYDSAGIAVVGGQESGTQLRRARGRVEALRALLSDASIEGQVGIAHARWATHGAATVENAHPHHLGGISVVHNGIVENHDHHRRRLQEEGATFSSQTDTEVIAHLFARARQEGASPMTALAEVCGQLTGSWALGLIDESVPSTVFFARRGSPLVVARSGEGHLLASDALAVAGHAEDVLFLEDGDHGYLTQETVAVLDAEGRRVDRRFQPIGVSADEVSRAHFDHFMRKEIAEQPAALLRCGQGLVQDARSFHRRAADLDELLLVACGTSLNAARVRAGDLAVRTGLRVRTCIASELRYDPQRPGPRTLVVGISQSGETADTLAALHGALEDGAEVSAICNVAGSAMDRLCRPRGGVLLTRAGPEIGVASTKAFVTQLLALDALGDILLGEAVPVLRGTQASEAVAAALLTDSSVQRCVDAFVDARSALFLGRGAQHGLALEGALKLAEVSYIHAQGFAAGEMKHGPIALIEPETPVVVLLPHDPEMRTKTLGSLAEVKARGAVVFAIGPDALRSDADLALEIEEDVDPAALLFQQTVVLQLLAYQVGVARGCDVDQPRNLAKSVTVE